MSDIQARERTVEEKGPRSTRTPAAAVLALMLAAVFLAGDREAIGQEQRPGADPPHVGRVVRAVEQSPRIGAAGTQVTLNARGLPALTPVQIVIGATRLGFEELALAQTSIDGEMEATVVIPEWSKRGQPHRFIVFNVYFSSVLAESGIFHVTDAEGKVVREGWVGTSGSACVVLEGDDGEGYRLIGPTDRLQIGDRASVEGVLRESEDGGGEGLSLNLELDSIR